MNATVAAAESVKNINKYKALKSFCMSGAGHCLMLWLGLATALATPGWALAVPSAAASDGPVDHASDAELRFKAGDYVAAAAAFEQALRVAPPAERPALQIRLGLAQIKLGLLVEAERHLRAARETADGRLAFQANRYLIQLLQRAERLDEAETVLVQTEAAAGHPALRVEDRLALVQQRANQHWRRQDFPAAFSTYVQLRDAAVAARQTDAEAAADAEASANEGMGSLLSRMGDHAGGLDLILRACKHKALATPRFLPACQVNAASIALRAGQWDQATALAQRVFDATARSGERQVSMHALNVRVSALAEAGDITALKVADDLLAQLNPDDEPSVRLNAQIAALGAADALGAHRRVLDAEPQLAVAAENDHLVRAELKLWSARALLAEGDRVSAVGALQRAAEALETLRAEVPLAQRAQFVDEVRQQVYEARARLAAEDGDAEGTAAALEEGKARTFIDTLRAHAAGLALDAAVDRFALARVGWQLDAASTAPTPVSQVLARLPPDLAVLDYGVLSDRLVVVLLSSNHAEVRQVTISAEALADLAADLRVAVREGRTWEAAAAAVAAVTLDPVRGSLARLFEGGVTRLAVVPHHSLHGVPFEVLPWADGLLVDRAAVFNAANLTALDMLLHKALKPRDKLSFVAVGDAHLDLPGARAEVHAVAALYPNARVLVGLQATTQGVTDALRGSSVAHVAVHGVRPRPNAPADLELADGHLQAHQIASLSLDTDLVVLSVCDSARGKPNRGDEVLGVLDRAFLTAGARAVVASRWPVHDQASVLFTTHLHRAYREGKPVLAAFREAQLALRAVGEQGASSSNRVRGLRALSVYPAPESYAHPYYWAAFSLRGDPR